MPKGEGGKAKVVRLTPEQREDARLNKARLLDERSARIRRQNKEKVRVLSSMTNFMIDKAQSMKVKAAVAVHGPMDRLYAFCAKLKAEMTLSAFRYFMRRTGYASILCMAGSFGAQNFNAAGELMWSTGFDYNQITTVGLNYLLDVMFHNGTQSATWYIGLIDSGGTYAAGDTMASHGTWTEYTEYSETLRQTWTEDAAAGGSITNSTTVDFSMNATGTVGGLFLVDDSAKSGTAGILWTALNFSGGNQAVSNGDTLKVTYTLTASA